VLNFTSDQWVIVALIFVLGLLVGGFLFSGGGRKWKHRYNSEVDRRTELEKTHAAREKEWREQDKLRETALRDAERQRAAATPPVVAAPVAAAPLTAAPVAGDRRDTNRDGVVDSGEAVRGESPVAGFMDKVLGRDRDRDGDGVADRKE
jgi:hypothetical protein